MDLRNFLHFCSKLELPEEQGKITRMLAIPNGC